MPISTKTFNEQAIRGIARLTEQANAYQEQIATGKKDLRPSQDPVAAARLSSVKDMEADLRRFTDNVSAAKTRLGLADKVLESVQNIMIRTNELAIQAANGTNSQADRLAIRAEVDQLRESMIGLANTADDRGQALFGGYVMRDSPFVKTQSGAVEYAGDTGQTTLLASDRLVLPTGISGAEAFMRIETDEGPVSVFDIFAGLSAALETAADATTSLNMAGGRVRIDVDTARAPQLHEITITGPLGSARIAAELVAGAPDALVSAINAVSETTGLTALAETNGSGVFVTAEGGGPIGLSEYQIAGMPVASATLSTSMTVTPVDAFGAATGAAVVLADADQAISNSIGQLHSGIEHVGLQRARVGAFFNAADIQSEALARKEVLVAETRSGIEDADMAEVISKLQSLLVNRDAAQQVFAKISQQSLFDYLR
ncbi:flagellar hook-associated protein FlgL [Roseicyclus sp.]|uniref:flagellar hook-associated protein FlgL n=1 Tax=Roseicyclus sp. TaxID=1914329 RepID=UPI003F6BB045